MIYDFDELLGRGILATRTGQSQDALRYLGLAAKISPKNLRVRLWLAAAAETVFEEREYLLEALKIDPTNLMARALLDRINPVQPSSPLAAADFVFFTCSSCGGKQHFDPDQCGMVCNYCHKIERLAPEDAAGVEMALPVDAGAWSILAGKTTCGACGAELTLRADRATLRCPFCLSDLITVHQSTPGLVPPDGIVPFRSELKDVVPGISKAWKIRQDEINRLIEIRDVLLTPIYLPFWRFSGRVQIRCALERRVLPTTFSPFDRVICKGDWAPKSWYECQLNDLLIYAANSLPQEVIHQILPFDLSSRLDYRPEILAGWQAESYQLALADAAVAANKQLRDQAFRNADHRLLFIEPSKLLEGDVLVLDRTEELLLLPV